METFVDYCKNYILENIENYESCSEYGCDLGWKITEGANCDGSLTYSNAAAMDYLREWYEECAEYWEYEKSEFGEVSHNPFENPEAYMVCMVIAGVNSILSECPVIEENWNDLIELDSKTIKSICDYVEEFDEVSLF